MQNFGEPFFLMIHEKETLAEVKVRIQNKLEVPDGEFSKGTQRIEHDKDFSSMLGTKLRKIWDTWIGKVSGNLLTINEFVKLGGDQLVPYYVDILGAILPCIADKEEKIRVVARETNEELRAIKADPCE